MNERAIVATDLSDASLFLVKHLSLLHTLNISSIILLQCPDYQEIASEVFPYIASIENEMLEKQHDILTSFGFKVEVLISPGNVSAQINRIAKERDINLVIVGSMGHSLVGGALLGGVASEVMLSTKHPLLIIRISLNEEREFTINHIEGESFLNHVLFCTDFTPPSMKVFDQFLVHMSNGEAKKVSLLHVIDEKHLSTYEKEGLDDYITVTKQRLVTMEQKVKSVGVKRVNSHIFLGSIQNQILNMLNNEDVTLSILGTTNASFIKELFSSSVSHYVARNSPVSVLLLPLS
ncbi:MAG: universal stress protein [Spirochaetia bacterium]|nr:universal stress protein [Spirochaetia bacterium]